MKNKEKHATMKTRQRTGTTWMVQAGRTVQWDKQKCGAITYDYVQLNSLTLTAALDPKILIDRREDSALAEF